MRPPVVFAAEMVDVQVQGVSALVDPLKIKAQAIEIFGEVQWKVEVDLAILLFRAGTG